MVYGYVCGEGGGGGLGGFWEVVVVVRMVFGIRCWWLSHLASTPQPHTQTYSPTPTPPPSQNSIILNKCSSLLKSAKILLDRLGKKKLNFKTQFTHVWRYSGAKCVNPKFKFRKKLLYFVVLDSWKSVYKNTQTGHDDKKETISPADWGSVNRSCVAAAAAGNRH